jgi:transglutaminase-like putative cysteine protease
LNITPEAKRIWTRDIFGNSILHAHFSSAAASDLVIQSEVLLRRFTPQEPSSEVSQASSADPFDYDPLEHNIVTGYLTPVYPEESIEIRNWTSTLPPLSDFPHAEAFVVEVAKLIHQSIAYRRREEKGVQTPASTLTLRSGSCRDLATLMMEALRHLGIAARFVSGYLDCPDTRAAKGSSHAWTECYFPHLGWRGFDPTTGRACDHRHIVIATSHHPRGAMPVSGRFFGATNAFQRLTVSIEFSSM